MRAHTFKEMKEIPPHTLKEMKEMISIVAWVKSQWVPGMTQAIWNSVVATTPHRLCERGHSTYAEAASATIPLIVNRRDHGFGKLSLRPSIFVCFNSIQN